MNIGEEEEPVEMPIPMHPDKVPVEQPLPAPEPVAIPEPAQLKALT